MKVQPTVKFVLRHLPCVQHSCVVHSFCLDHKHKQRQG